MQHLNIDLLASPPHLRTIQASAPPSTRLALPSRNVTAHTIEEAFVRFILACNPGVPLDSDTVALREAFRTPPKSGGKSFSTWTLFELIAQFQSKEIKTWADLALKLGVEPPDQGKGQSAQKIQQYAVRLKRWMHSMHIDAFFEYLLENPHPYWTEVPLDPNPITGGDRDGVAAEDDMALRSLLPHIRPRRGRKRPEDEKVSRSPSQKPKMDAETSQNIPNVTGLSADQYQLDLWAAAQPDTRSDNYLFAQDLTQDQFIRTNTNMAPTETHNSEEFAQTPITSQSYLVMTPATTSSYWSEQPSDPKPGMTPLKSKTNRRHGAKVVSSAWRSGGPGGSGKTRGRPPLNRQTSQTHSQGGAAARSFPTFPAGPAQSASPPKAFIHPSLHRSPHAMNVSLETKPIMTPSLNNRAVTLTSTQNPQQGIGSMKQEYDIVGPNNAEAQLRSSRPIGSKPIRSRLSLQVPERTGGEVRLATPQGQQELPAFMVEGTMAAAGDQASIAAHPQDHSSLNARMVGTDAQVMNSFSSAAAQNMYNMMYEQQAIQQHQRQDQNSQHIQHMPQPRQNTNALYPIATTTTHHIAATNHPALSPADTLFHQPDPAESTSADTRPAEVNLAYTSNRTSLEALEAMLTYELLGAKWTDAQGRQIATCGIDEAGAVAREILENARRAAGSRQGFLMNVATIAGATWLKQADGQVRVQRVGVLEGEKDVYDVHWQLQLGDVKSGFSLREVVARQGWLRQKGSWEKDVEGKGKDVNVEQAGGEEEGEEENAAMWREKYRGLLGVVQEQNAELSGFRQGVISLCRPRRTRRDREGGEVAE